MSVGASYNDTIRTARMVVVQVNVDAGSGPGILKLRDSANTVMADVPLNDPCATVTTPTMTMLGFPKRVQCLPAAGDGAILDNAIITDSNGVVCAGVAAPLTVGVDNPLEQPDVKVQTVNVVAGMWLNVLVVSIGHA